MSACWDENQRRKPVVRRKKKAITGIFGRDDARRMYPAPAAAGKL